MTFFTTQGPPPELAIPCKYTDIPVDRRWEVRESYNVAQKGMCYHCQCSLAHPPPDFITDKPIHKDLFPKNFFQHPVHLHHDHHTDMTLGAVHAYCNAVLWEHHGE